MDTYIGEMGCKLEERTSEHITALSENTPNESAYTDHLLRTNHDPEKTAPKLLHIETNYRRGIARENQEILIHLRDLNYTVPNRYTPEGISSQ